MSTSSRARSLLGTLLVALGACSGPPPELPPAPRGVLLISVDSLRADHLSCYGYRSETAPEIPTSPRIDALLADQGVLFESAVSTTSWTVPAHKSLFTGLPDELHGGTTLGPLPTSRSTLPQLFAAEGWRTAGFFSGPNLHPWYGFERGFERYVDCSNAVIDDEHVFELSDAQQLRSMGDVQRTSHQGVTGPKLVAAFDAWFGGLERDEPFFAFVHMWDVHFDYAAPADYDVFFPGYDGWLDGSNYHELGQRAERDPRDLQRLRALYDAEIRFTDHHIGLMLERLRAAGRLDDTLVVLVSDHGEEFFEHGKFGHNRTLFEEVVHVPMILRYPPGLPAGVRLGDLVSLADVAPTLLELARVPVPQAMWGRSLWPAVSGQLAARSAPLDLRLFREADPLRAVRGADYKVVQDGADATPVEYDLARDPREQGPAAPAAGARLDEARGQWAQLSIRLQQLGDVGGSSVMPEELLRQINQAGYTGAGGGD